MLKPIKLTAAQVRHFDEIEIDRAAAKQAYETALNYYQNRLNELTKASRELWKDLGEIHDLDIPNKSYKLKMVEGALSIVEMSEEEWQNNGH